MSNHSLFSAIKHDFFYGFLKQWYLFFPFVLYATFMTISFQIEVSESLHQKISVADAWFHLTEGMPLFNPSDMNAHVQFSWIVLYLYLFILIGYYPMKELNSYGIQVILRERSRNYWWISKCVWLICMIFTFYLVLFFSVLIIVGFSGKMSFMIQANIHLAIRQVVVNDLTYFEFWIQGCIVPFLVTIHIAVMQFNLMLFLDSVLSIVVVAIYLMVPVFYYNSCVLSSFLMLRRNQVLVQSNEMISMGFEQLILGIAVMTIFSFLGNWYFSRIDFVNKKGEIER